MRHRCCSTGIEDILDDLATLIANVLDGCLLLGGKVGFVTVVVGVAISGGNAPLVGAVEIPRDDERHVASALFGEGERCVGLAVVQAVLLLAGSRLLALDSLPDIGRIQSSLGKLLCRSLASVNVISITSKLYSGAVSGVVAIVTKEDTAFLGSLAYQVRQLFQVSQTILGGEAKMFSFCLPRCVTEPIAQIDHVPISILDYNLGLKGFLQSNCAANIV